MNLLAAVQAMAMVGAGQAAGNLVATGAPNVRPAPLTVTMDDEALAIFDDLDQEMTRRQRVAVGSEQSAVLARVWENTAKVALVKAVSANPPKPIIRGVDAQWAREVVDYCVATLLIQAGRHLADNEIERLHKRVIELIRAAGAKGIRQNELTRRTQFIEPKLRREILLTLIESEQVVPTLIRQRGRPGTVYRLADLAPGLSSNVIASSIDAKQQATLMKGLNKLVSSFRQAKLRSVAHPGGRNRNRREA